MTIIKAVVFDFGRVLTLPPSRDAVLGIQQLSGVPPDKFRNAYLKRRDAFDCDEMTVREYWDDVTRPYGVELTDSQLEELFVVDIAAWMSPQASMVKWAQEIQNRGVKTAILSNMRKDFVQHVMRFCPWLERFDLRIFSGEVRLWKPDPSIFRYCLASLAVRPEHSLFIDDVSANVEAAIREGLNGIVFESPKHLAHALRSYEGLPPLEV